MREMDVLSPGSSHDRCQYLKTNPRREGLPRTVTQWRQEREERRQKRREERVRLGKPDLKSDSETEEPSAFAISNAATESTSGGFRRSKRLGAKGGESPPCVDLGLGHKPG